ncbi:hypothetical protein Ahia01_000558700 [Argonauta hians]
MELIFLSTYSCKRCIRAIMILLALISLSFFMEDHAMYCFALPVNNTELNTKPLKMNIQIPASNVRDDATEMLRSPQHKQNKPSRGLLHIYKRQINQKDMIQVLKLIQKIRELTTAPSMTMSSLRFR